MDSDMDIVTLEDLKPPVLSASSVSSSAQAMGLEMAGNEALPLNFGKMSVSVAFTSDIGMCVWWKTPTKLTDSVFGRLQSLHVHSREILWCRQEKRATTAGKGNRDTAIQKVQSRTDLSRYGIMHLLTLLVLSRSSSN